MLTPLVYNGENNLIYMGRGETSRRLTSQVFPSHLLKSNLDVNTSTQEDVTAASQASLTYGMTILPTYIDIYRYRYILYETKSTNRTYGSGF